MRKGCLHATPKSIGSMTLASKGTVRVGTAGWSYDDWNGIVYPPDMPKGRHPLELLSQWFDAVEINASFYRPLNPRHGPSWLGKVADNPRFRFSAKLWQRFTHQRETWPTAEETAQYVDGLAPLHESGKLSAVLAQFPWSFKRTAENRKWLGRIAETFRGYPLAVEVRHTSWNQPEVFEQMRAHGIAVCNIDQPIFNDSIEPADVVTAPLGYIRLHGRNRHAWFNEKADRNDRYNYLYSPEELQPWLEKIGKMRELVNELFVVTNNHYAGQAVVNAIEIERAVNHRKPVLHDALLKAYPRLAED